MKIKLLIFLTLILVTATLSFAQEAQKEINPFPFAQYNNPNFSLLIQVANPNGYERYSSDRLSLFQHWLSNLPLMPQGTPVLNWKGKKVAEADTLNRILDMNINSKYVTDADIPVLLLLNFFHLQGTADNFNVILKDNLVVNYKNWLHGKYIEEKGKDIYYRAEGLTRVDTDEEFQQYLDFVTKHFDTKSLRRNIEHVNSTVFKASNVFIQFKQDDPDSIGHTAVILDVAVGKDKTRRMLVAYGGNPAQSVIVPNTGKSAYGQWFSLEQLREHLDEFGMGYMYRWKAN